MKGQKEWSSILDFIVTCNFLQTIYMLQKKFSTCPKIFENRSSHRQAKLAGENWENKIF